MKNRLTQRIIEIRKKKEKLFCAFVTLGYPSLSVTDRLIQEFEKVGVDIIELGFPFSDPIADGPTIQFSSERALSRGVCVRDAFRMVRSLRKKGVQVPILFFSYLNPILKYGIKRFVRDSKKAGFDGVIVPDLPPGEEPLFEKECRNAGISQVFLIAPTTVQSRMSVIAKQSNGFIYYVSLRGVTGARKALPDDIRRTLDRLKKVTAKPVLVGFGVSSPGQGRMLSEISEGVIVGSVIIQELKRSKGRLQPVVQFVQKIIRSVKSS